MICDLCKITYGDETKDGVLVVDVSGRDFPIQSDRITFVRIVEKGEAVTRTGNKLITGHAFVIFLIHLNQKSIGHYISWRIFYLFVDKGIVVTHSITSHFLRGWNLIQSM